MMIYDVLEPSTRETLEARYVGFWTPETMQTAHPINSYEAGLHQRDLPHPNGERIPDLTIAPFVGPPQHLNLSTWPSGMCEVAKSMCLIFIYSPEGLHRELCSAHLRQAFTLVLCWLAFGSFGTPNRCRQSCNPGSASCVCPTSSPSNQTFF